MDLVPVPEWVRGQEQAREWVREWVRGLAQAPVPEWVPVRVSVWIPDVGSKSARCSTSDQNRIQDPVSARALEPVQEREPVQEWGPVRVWVWVRVRVQAQAVRTADWRPRS